MRRTALALTLSAWVGAAHAQPTSQLQTIKAHLANAAAELAQGPTACEVDAQWPAGSPRAAALEAVLRAAVEEGIERAGGELVPESAHALRLGLSTAGGHLRVELAVASQREHWLERLFGWSEGLARHRWRVPLDAELRQHVATLPRLTSSTVVARTYRLPGRGYLDVAVHDVDEGGPAEIVLLGSGGIEVVRMGTSPSGRARPELVERLSLPAGDRPGVGVQRPIGTLSIDAEGVLGRVRHRAQPFRVQMSGVAYVSDPCPEMSHPLADACAMPVDGRDYFASELLPRLQRRPPARAPTSFYTRRAQWVRRTDGSAAWVEVVVTPRGRLVARTGDRDVGLAGFGAAIGMADVDADGNAELLTSSSNLVGSGDQLTVLRVRETGALRRLWQSGPIEGSVMVAGSGDIDGDGTPELLAIEEQRARAILWVIR
ncbi:MAG: VCBS repeat-containing protein [Myxococcota bacterium]